MGNWLQIYYSIPQHLLVSLLLSLWAKDVWGGILARVWALNLSEQGPRQGYPYHGLTDIISALSIKSLSLFFFFFLFLENFLRSSTTYLLITLPENISTMTAPMSFLSSDFAQYMLRYLLLLLIILQLLCPPLEMTIVWIPFHIIRCRHVRSETGSLHP